MKKIRILILSLTAVFAVNTAFADEAKSNELKAKEKTKELSSRLSLTAEQMTKVEALYLEAFNKLDQVKAEKTTVSEEDKQAIITEQEAKLKEVLTADQWAKYEEAKIKKAARKEKATQSK